MTLIRNGVTACAVVWLVAACGDSSSASTSPTVSGLAAVPGVSVGPLVLSSTMRNGSTDFATGPMAVAGPDGITLTAKSAGGFASSQPNDTFAIPSNNFAVHVEASNPSSPSVLYGVLCSGADVNNTYLLLTDSRGDYLIAEVKGGTLTSLRQGTNAPIGFGTITFDAACVTPRGSPNGIRLVLSLDGTVVASYDVKQTDIGQSNTVGVFAVLPSGTAGSASVTFHDFELRSAQGG